MIDLETLGRKPGCAVLQIGACVFDPAGQVVGVGAGFEVDLCLSLEAGFTVERDTLAWWLNQDMAFAKPIVMGPMGISPEDAAAEFLKWVRGWGSAIKGVWCKGASFDFPILEEFLRLAVGEPPPWKYWQERCFRTLAAEFDPMKRLEPRGSRRAHHALDDARHQAQWAVNIFRCEDEKQDNHDDDDRKTS